MTYGYRIDGKGRQSGFLVVEDDYSVSVKSLLRTTPLFYFSDVKGTVQDGKDLKIELRDGHLVELRANSADLKLLEQMIGSERERRTNG